MSNEITLRLETKTVESKVIKSEWKWMIDEPTFGMSYEVYKYFITIEKNMNLIKRLNNRKL